MSYSRGFPDVMFHHAANSFEVNLEEGLGGGGPEYLLHIPPHDL